MQIGIDFGTSYSAAAACIDGKLHGVRFGDHAQFRTAVFFPAAVPNPDDFVLTDALEAEVESHIRSARAAQRRALDNWQQRLSEAQALPAERRVQAMALISEPAERTESDLRAAALRAVRHSWMERSVRDSRSASVKVNDAIFGDDAIDAYISDGFGHLVESPKSMLGYNLLPGAKKIILHIATHVLEHIRLSATRQLGVPVRAAILGRPVEFKSAMGPEGTTQALSMLTEAAQAAGFEQVSFLEEPAAAAMHYHTQRATPERSLIVDVGGGTTDIAYAEVGGPAASPRIFGSWGLPKGGTDIDIEMSLNAFMPLFGRGEPGIPVHHFREAASVQSPPLQREFRSHNYRNTPAPFRHRLMALQRLGATSQLNREAERMKIHLGAERLGRVDLDFIEDGLTADLDRAHHDAAYGGFLDRLRAVLDRARLAIGETPDSIFLTGGSSRSPAIQSTISAMFPAVPLVIGDASLGVVSGLAAAAAMA
ncbi:Hsp70 family protein [Tahibacter amnicola]|uniref:Hsp70 family protein n=1 Tax=Tahibacter amnicola TaxID=2976241 RepID=A0ABY6B991_9GAMM|nr:Hsp70 family protein [Tahibacter amnicola]UXI66636.1 Hsp70 family protein [Tahibacter amnicola]